VFVGLSSFAVHVKSAGTNVTGANVTVQDSDLGNASARATTNSQGIASFLVPPGSYSVFVADLGNSSKGTASLNLGSNPTYQVSFPPPPTPAGQSIEVGLIAVITLLGIAGNVWVWMLRKRPKSATS
jgi:hypothetical protein